MNTTPVANRLHIGIFGKRNVGKSSFINAITGQRLSIVSDVPGTTTDPVGKAMEIAGIGPVYLYDTAGLDDTGDLGRMRTERTRDIIEKINLGVLVTTQPEFDDFDEGLLRELADRKVPVILVFNKADLYPLAGEAVKKAGELGVTHLHVSSTTGENIEDARKAIARIGSGITVERDTILGDIINHGDIVCLVVPIDLGAPRGRLILPQVQVIRDILDNDAIAITVKEREIEYVLKRMSEKPALVICDSQVVLKVSGDIPPDVKFTTFSILFSRQKGELATFVKGVRAIDTLEDGDRVLVMEACTHHPLPDDIGRVKIPRWIRNYTGRDIAFDTNAGPFRDKDMSKYKLIVHCGACMINRAEMMSRLAEAERRGVPVTNYGIAISYVHGVLKRALSPFPYEKSLLEDPLS
ncbi:MAG TPA: [FeFe] hydrogenase H-cluster maturation GTPase HydF [Deltaproteobacteria bacterium]|jgi:[FeFe] hydrogenase H-cluster maturation GTPase HydF|nr:[FeFe] hydrogenase H-cluster maturation GTPase HydF [Deltaproteobacteria bacterium]HOI06569.1 [FeFe] hydrogenase H-cluster maturation GTPase HydF [Deltaproteobacteria bacterium]